MAKKNSVPMRTDPEFRRIINQVMAKKLMEQNRKVKIPRITKAIANQYKKYPELMRELMDAELK